MTVNKWVYLMYFNVRKLLMFSCFHRILDLIMFALLGLKMKRVCVISFIFTITYTLEHKKSCGWLSRKYITQVGTSSTSNAQVRLKVLQVTACFLYSCILSVCFSLSRTDVTAVVCGFHFMPVDRCWTTLHIHNRNQPFLFAAYSFLFIPAS